MKKLIQKDKQNRKIARYYETQTIVLQSIINNSNLSKLTQLKGYRLLNEMSLKSFKVKHNNRCVLTGRRKRINYLYNISRISFLKLARNGNIAGLKKSSW